MKPGRDDETSNPSENPSFEDLLVSRRPVLGGALGAAALAFLDGRRALAGALRPEAGPALTGFSSVPASQEDRGDDPTA
jgi:hypothetical protein